MLFDLKNTGFNPYSTEWKHGTKFERIDVNIHNVLSFLYKFIKYALQML